MKMPHAKCVCVVNPHVCDADRRQYMLTDFEGPPSNSDDQRVRVSYINDLY